MTLGLRIITDGSSLHCCSATPACGDAHGSFEFQIKIFEKFENSEIGRSFLELFVTQPCAIACFVVSLPVYGPPVGLKHHQVRILLFPPFLCHPLVSIKN